MVLISLFTNEMRRQAVLDSKIFCGHRSGWSLAEKSGGLRRGILAVGNATMEEHLFATLSAKASARGEALATAAPFNSPVEDL
jgi:hypothetical protein